MDFFGFGWDEDAWDAYKATAVTNPRLHARLTDALVALAENPGAARLRARRLHRPPLFVIAVGGGGEDWIVLWDLAVDGVPQVWFVGSSPF